MPQITEIPDLERLKTIFRNAIARARSAKERWGSRRRSRSVSVGEAALKGLGLSQRFALRRFADRNKHNRGIPTTYIASR